MNLGRLDRADSLLEDALGIGRRCGEESLAATSLTWLGLVAATRGDSPRAEDRFAESLEVFRGAGDEWGVAGASNLLGSMICERGDRGRGRKLLEESLGIYRGIGDEFAAASSLNSLGYTALLFGGYEEAAAYLEESVAICRRRKGISDLAACLCNLGHAKLFAGDIREAEEHCREAISLCREANEWPVLAETLEVVAALSAESGRDLRAAKLFGALSAFSENMDFSPTPGVRRLLEPSLDKARKRLGEAKWEESVSEGKDMTLEEAAELATDEEERSRFAG